MPEPRPRRLNPWVTLALIAALVVLFVAPLVLRPARGDGEAFGGTDARATDVIQRDHPAYERWVEPIFEPGSAEVESGLFALQAALGAGALGYVAGRLHGRRLRDEGRRASDEAA